MHFHYSSRWSGRLKKQHVWSVVFALLVTALFAGCGLSENSEGGVVRAAKAVKLIPSKNALSECPQLKGQIILMTGTVTYKRIVLAGCSVELDNHPVCTFGRENASEITKLNKGDFVCIKGRVEDTTIEAHLSSCVLVDTNHIHDELNEKTNM